MKDIPELSLLGFLWFLGLGLSLLLPFPGEYSILLLGDRQSTDTPQSPELGAEIQRHGWNASLPISGCC